MNTTPTEAIEAQIVRQGTGARVGAGGPATSIHRTRPPCRLWGWCRYCRASMGQPITVVEHDSRAHPGVVRFEVNRPLSGMGHERYRATDVVDDVRPVDEVARR